MIPAELLPVVLSLGSAVFFALGIQFLNLGLPHADSRTGTMIEIGTTAAFYWLLSPVFLKAEYWLTPATLIFVAVGLFRPVLSANLALIGVHRLGPILASALTSTTPLFAATFGILLLGEALTWPIVIGTVAVVAGTMVQARPDIGSRTWSPWALAFPLGAACLRSFAHVLIRIGLAIVPAPLYAGLIAYSVSFLVALAVESRRRESRRVNWRAPGLAWFPVAGVMHGFAVWTMNAALQIAPVTVVVPLVSATPVITLALSWLLFRREIVTWRKVAMVALVVGGVAVIAVNR